METVLYFTLPEEDFACIPLRTFLSTLLANVFLKPILDMLSDPDFLNLQVARLVRTLLFGVFMSFLTNFRIPFQFSKETPPVEYFIKALRQSTDLSELRACRQLITKHMNLVIVLQTTISCALCKILMRSSVLTNPIHQL